MTRAPVTIYIDEDTFAARLRIALAARNMRAVALMEPCGVSSAAVSKWTTGECYPAASKLVALSKALGVTVDWLMGQPERVESRAKDWSYP